MKNFNIDPEFRDKIPPLTADEFAKLEENILADGEVREPLVLWNNTIIDGHHRWAIIQKHPEIPYKTKQMTFADKWEAIYWICRNQMGRRNISDVQRTVLIAEAQRAQRMTQGGFRVQPRDAQNGKFTANEENLHLRADDKETTREKIARQFGVGESIVQNSEYFLQGLEAGEQVVPGFREAVTSGAAKAPKAAIIELRDMDEDKKQALAQAIYDSDKEKMKALRPQNPHVPINDKLDPPVPIEAANATPIVHTVAYNVQDFREELMFVVKHMDTSFRLTLVDVHPEMLKTEDGRKAALEVLSAAESEIEKYKAIVREAENEKVSD